MNRWLTTLCLLLFSFSTLAQDAPPSDDIEGLFEQEEKNDEAKENRKNRKSLEELGLRKKKLPKVKKLSNLSQLESFGDIAVIQKRYLPKTGRFEGYIAAATTINDSFFTSQGLNGRLGYYLSERWGLEGTLSWFSISDRDVTSRLQDIAVNTAGAVSTELHYGLNLKWIPIYGKYAYFNQKIIPFDLYFNFGIGMANTIAKRFKQTGSNRTPFDISGSPLVFNVSSGQVFAISKAMAFRWEIGFNFFQNDAVLPGEEQSLENNMFLQLGLSFFFPEAKYR